MTRYTATIRHHSIASARVVPVGDTLAAAKRAATEEFGDDMQDYTIVICDTQSSDPSPGMDIVASRRCGDKRWSA